MNWGTVCSILMIITGLAAIAALIATWVMKGAAGMFTHQELYNNAVMLILIAIWFSLCSLIHVAGE